MDDLGLVDGAWDGFLATCHFYWLDPMQRYIVASNFGFDFLSQTVNLFVGQLVFDKRDRSH